jgi:hypothetical protein
MYLIGIVNEAGDLTVQTGTQVLRRTKQAAIKEYWKMVFFALAGETVICYNNDMMKNYEELMPQHLSTQDPESVLMEERMQYFKIERVKDEMNLSTAKAKKTVAFIDWLTDWDAELNLMFKAYQTDTRDNDMPFMGFAEFIYSNDKTLPKEYVEGIAAAN